MADGEWLSLGDAARRLGTTPDAIRQRIRRNRVLARRGNDGRPRVFVESGPTEQVEQASEQSSVIPNRTASEHTEHDVSPLVAELRDQIERMRADTTEHQTRHDAEMAQERAETARRLTERDSLHLDTLGRLQAQAALERSLWLERVDAAELRAERVEQQLDQVLVELLGERRRPWWRRLFGG